MEFTNRFRDIVLTPDAVGKIDELLTKFPIGKHSKQRRVKVFAVGLN